MKLVFTKSNLNKAVGIVMKAVPTRTTMNILECILIDATTNEIKFTGNDMELGIETIVEGEIIEKGKIAIDAKLFSEIVRKLPDNDITLTTDSNNNALITCEKSKFNIAGKSGDDFSYLPAIIKDKMITLSQFQLKEVINQTIFSIAINDNNKMMTGELFEVNEGTLKVVGLDGHRIAIRNIKLEGRADDVKAIKEALASGVIDAIATDHAPHHPTEKARPFDEAPFGVVGLETAIPVTITELVRTGILTPLQMVEKMSYNPAKIIGIDRGVLAPGKVADIAVVDPTAEYDIDSNRFASKGKNTPFEGKHVYGKVLYTLVNGRVVYSDHNGTEILIEREVPKL